MIRASVSIGRGGDAFRIGSDAAIEALQEIDTTPTLALVFASVSLDQDELMRGVRNVLPHTPMAGMSTAGEITSSGLSTEQSVIVVLIVSDQFTAATYAAHHLSWNAERAGQELADGISNKIKKVPKEMLMFFDALSADPEELIHGIGKSWKRNPQVVGVAAGDNMLFHETFQYWDGYVHSGSVVGMSLDGQYHQAIAATSAFLPVSLPKLVTKTRGRVVVEIDNKPALHFYETYMGSAQMSFFQGERLKTIAGFYPLGVRRPSYDDEMLIRAPVSVGKDGSIGFLVPIPLQSEVRLMMGDAELAIAETRRTTERLLKNLGKQPTIVFMFSSVMRKNLLGRRVDEEIRAVQDILGREVPIVGCHTYGEVSGVIPEFQNGSLLLWAIAP